MGKKKHSNLKPKPKTETAPCCLTPLQDIYLPSPPFRPPSFPQSGSPPMSPPPSRFARHLLNNWWMFLVSAKAFLGLQLLGRRFSAQRITSRQPSIPYSHSVVGPTLSSLRNPSFLLCSIHNVVSGAVHSEMQHSLFLKVFVSVEIVNSKTSFSPDYKQP